MIAYHFPPILGSSGVHRTLQFARYLPKHGWEALVVSVSPLAYPMVTKDQLDDIPSDLIVQRAFALDTARHLSLHGKYFNLTAFPDRWISWWPTGVFACLRLVRRYRPNVIWSTYPIATAHLIGLTTKKLTGLPWIADFRDPMVWKSHHTSNLAHRVWRNLEAAVVKNASSCVFATNSMMLDYIDRYPKAESGSWLVIENGFDETIFEKVEHEDTQLYGGQKNEIQFLHSGILYGEGRNPGPLFEALKLVVEGKHNKIKLVLRGSGTPEIYQRMAADYGLSKIVKVLEPIGYHEAIKEILCADAVITIQGTPFNRQIPAKVYEYIRSGRPILAITDPVGETAKLLNQWDGVHSARAESIFEIKTAIYKILDEIAKSKVPIRPKHNVIRLSRSARAAELAMVLNRIITH